MSMTKMDALSRRRPGCLSFFPFLSGGCERRQGRYVSTGQKENAAYIVRGRQSLREDTLVLRGRGSSKSKDAGQ